MSSEKVSVCKGKEKDCGQPDRKVDDRDFFLREGEHPVVDAALHLRGERYERRYPVPAAEFEDSGCDQQSAGSQRSAIEQAVHQAYRAFGGEQAGQQTKGIDAKIRERRDLRRPGRLPEYGYDPTYCASLVLAVHWTGF